MTVVKKKAALKKKVAVKKKAAVKKKKASDLPQVNIPEDTFKAPDVEKYEDGFILTISIALLGVAIFGILWLLTK